MEVTNGLLVAMMFIMVLSIGIGNILMSIPPLFNRRVEFAIERVHLSWVVLLLFMHLNLFWQVLFILDLEEWDFVGFVYTVAGPIALLLATSILLPDPARASGDPTALYLESARPAFTLLAIVMAWLVGMDVIFGTGVQATTFWNLASLALAATLAASTNLRLHTGGAVVAWALFLSLLAASELGFVT